MKLCDLFSCDMDTLLRGDVSLLFGTDTAGYDRHMNAFARAITAGVGLVLLGVTLLLLPVSEAHAVIPAALFAVLLTAAVILFITAGIGHGAFVKAHPTVEPFYSPEQTARFDRRFPLLIALPVGLILLGVAAVVLLTGVTAPAWIGQNQWERLAVSLLLLCITVAVSTLVWTGIQKAKYNIAAYNRADIPTPESRRTQALWGSVMVGATAVYVGAGLVFDLWDRAWVVYPIVALLCAAVTIFLNRNRD